MKKILLLLLLLSTPSIAADNAVILTQGAGVTMRCKDVGGLVQSCLTILGDTSGNPIISGGSVPVTISQSTSPFFVLVDGTTPTSKATVSAGALSVAVQNANNNGQATMLLSSPVVIASNQSTITITNLSLGIVGSTAPTTAGLSGAQSGANIVGIVQADTTKQISMSSATTTQMVALSGSTKIYATSYDIIAGGTTNVTFVYGTGSNCGTGTTSLAGLYALTAQAGIAKGSGLGPVLVVPAGNALCVVNSAAVAIGGSLSYTQF